MKLIHDGSTEMRNRVMSTSDFPLSTLANNESETWNRTQIEMIEKHYRGKYILDTSLRTKGGGWSNFPASIFYTEIPHPRGSNYFAIYIHPLDNQMFITNGLSAIEEPIEGLLIDNSVIYSKYCHHLVHFHGVEIDGGREYCRISGERINEAIPVLLKVVGPEIHITRKCVECPTRMRRLKNWIKKKLRLS